MYANLSKPPYNVDILQYVEDDGIPALIPMFIKHTGINTPLLDFRMQSLVEYGDFERILKETFDTKPVLVYSVIDNRNYSQSFFIGDIYFSISRSQSQKSVKDDLDASFDVIKIKDPNKEVIKLEEFSLVTNINLVYGQKDQNLVELLQQKFEAVRFNGYRADLENAVYTIGSGNNGLFLSRHTISVKNYSSDILKSNYNDNFQNAYDKLYKFLSAPNESGLVLFKGKPGTGKSSLIIHLTSLAVRFNSKFVFVPSSFASALADPSFLSFALASLKNSILILEDAEEALMARGNGITSAVTNILNISDGILGKVLNLKLIATVNREKNVDDALKRKGRLKLEYNFDLLTVEKANALLKKLNISGSVDKPTSLADIYNLHEAPVIESKEIRKRMGF